MASFNHQQRMAVEHVDHPCLVLAGPGSGKTTVITHRTKKLIEEEGISPSNILVITFTKAAAMEMQQRFLQLMGGKRLPVSFGTFHAVYFQILKYAYNYRTENIIREEKKYEILRNIVHKTELDISDENEFVANLISEISNVKGEMLDVAYYYSKNCPEEVFKKIFREYNDTLIRANLIDFDDMLVMCYELLTKRKDILKLWQDKYRYILIDEFQDINRVQYEVIRLLAKPQDNLFIVGDDDQSIYRFRGARPEIMLNFEKDYPEAKKIILDTNYRSTPEIVAAAGKLIRNNKKRFEKQIRAERKNGSKPVILPFDNVYKECNYILEEIEQLIAKGLTYQDMAVLYRTNTNPRTLLEKLMEHNIPFCMKDVIPNLYDHFIAKDIIAYINAAVDFREKGVMKRGDMLRLINRPKRYISRDVFPRAEVNLEDVKRFYQDKGYVLERISKLEYDLAMIRNMNPYAAIQYIRHGIGYEEYLTEYAEYRRMKPEELYDVLEELSEAAKPYKTYQEWFKKIEEYGEELKKQARERQEKKDGITLATMHSSKGLEYRAVFIIDANETITPHKKALLLEDIEEERRLFYVAVTRAKDWLYICHCRERYGKETDVSRFVEEMVSMLDELTVGQEIRHKKFGTGKITQIRDGKIKAVFADGKEYVFDAKFCLGNGIIKV
ncbi:MAG: ATP-dependent helicase [Candidatus Gastranaerophilaceae bacterium]